MTLEFKLPELGEQIERGDVVGVLVSEGDVIAAEQAVIEVETEKATMEVPCPISGRVKEIYVSVGDSIAVGQPVMLLEPIGETSDDTKLAAVSEEVAETVVTHDPGKDIEPVLSFVIPDMGEGVSSGQVVAVLVAVGDPIAREQALIEVETEKATVEIPSDVSGVVKDIFVKPGDTVQAGQKILDVTPDGAEVQAKPSEQSTEPEKEKEPRAENLPKRKPLLIFGPSRMAVSRMAVSRSLLRHRYGNSPGISVWSFPWSRVRGLEERFQWKM